MAEFIMKHLVAQAGRASDFEIASAAVSTPEILQKPTTIFSKVAKEC
jgi:protein-tyrosine-phosphatase